MVFGSVGPVYCTLKTGPTDPNDIQGLKDNISYMLNTGKRPSVNETFGT